MSKNRFYRHKRVRNKRSPTFVTSVMPRKTLREIFRALPQYIQIFSVISSVILGFATLFLALRSHANNKLESEYSYYKQIAQDIHDIGNSQSTNFLEIELRLIRHQLKRASCHDAEIDRFFYGSEYIERNKINCSLAEETKNYYDATERHTNQTREEKLQPVPEKDAGRAKPSHGISPYNMDIFWCESQSAEENYSNRYLAGKISDIVNAQNLVNRLRVRKLSIEKTHDDNGYYSYYFGRKTFAYVVPGEAEIFNKVSAALREKNLEITLSPAGGFTDNYLSLFVCHNSRRLVEDYSTDAEIILNNPSLPSQ